MILPENVNNFLQKNDYLVHEVLQYNETKKTFVVKLKKQSVFYVLKGFSLDTPKNIKESFLVEKNFLKEFSECEVIPNMFVEMENYIILEYINGSTLREYLISDKYLNDNSRILQGLDKFYNCLEKYKKMSYIKELNIDNVYRYIYVLTLSTPFQLKHIKFSLKEKIINRLVYMYLKLKVKLLFFKYKNQKIEHICFSHNDFHYNNILVTDNTVKFIDFENIKKNGNFDFDVLFLLVLIEGIDKNRDVAVYLNKLLLECELNRKIYKIFYIALSFNKKFRINQSH